MEHLESGEKRSAFTLAQERYRFFFLIELENTVYADR